MVGVHACKIFFSTGCCTKVIAEPYRISRERDFEAQFHGIDDHLNENAKQPPQCSSD